MIMTQGNGSPVSIFIIQNCLSGKLFVGNYRKIGERLSECVMDKY